MKGLAEDFSPACGDAIRSLGSLSSKQHCLEDLPASPLKTDTFSVEGGQTSLPHFVQNLRFLNLTQSEKKLPNFLDVSIFLAKT